MKLFCQILTFLRARTFSITARMTSRPVASPRAWTIRGCECPPSRVEGDLAVDPVEDRPPLDQLGNPPGGLADDQGDDLRVAEPLAGGDGVGDVVLEVVLGVHHPRDTALGIRAVALADLVLGDDQGAERLRHAEGGPEAGDAPADDQDVGEVVRQVLGVERGQVATGEREWLEHDLGRLSNRGRPKCPTASREAVGRFSTAKGRQGRREGQARPGLNVSARPSDSRRRSRPPSSSPGCSCTPRIGDAAPGGGDDLPPSESPPRLSCGIVVPVRLARLLAVAVVLNSGALRFLSKTRSFSGFAWMVVPALAGALLLLLLELLDELFGLVLAHAERLLDVRRELVVLEQVLELAEPEVGPGHVGGNRRISRVGRLRRDRGQRLGLIVELLRAGIGLAEATPTIRDALLVRHPVRFPGLLAIRRLALQTRFARGLARLVAGLVAGPCRAVRQACRRDYPTRRVGLPVDPAVHRVCRVDLRACRQVARVDSPACRADRLACPVDPPACCRAWSPVVPPVCRPGHRTYRVVRLAYRMAVRRACFRVDRRASRRVLPACSPGFPG